MRYSNLLCALNRPDEGAIQIAGVDLAKTQANALDEFRLRHVCFAFQDFNLLPVLSERENLEFVAALQNME